jgi:hypothetical protein
LQKAFATQGFKAEIQPLSYFQDDYGLKAGAEGEDQNDDEEEEEEDDENGDIEDGEDGTDEEDL